MFFDFKAKEGVTSLPFIKEIPAVSESGASIEIEPFSLENLMQLDSFKYFSYKGSLTTPECYESVTWIVSSTILDVNPDDIAALRTVHDGNGYELDTNDRPPQDWNLRPITYQ